MTAAKALALKFASMLYYTHTTEHLLLKVQKNNNISNIQYPCTLYSGETT